MTWEEIIKVRQGPLKEEDALRTEKERAKEYDRFAREVGDLATELASLIAKNGVKITNENGQPIESVNRVLAEMMNKIAESYEFKFGDVDRGNTRTQAEAMSVGNELMRRTASKLRDAAKKL